MDVPPPILVFDVPVPATPTPIHPSSTALKVAKAKNLLDGIEKLNPKVCALSPPLLCLAKQGYGSRGILS